MRGAGLRRCALCTLEPPRDGGVAKSGYSGQISNLLGADFSFLLRDVGGSSDCASSSILLARVFN